MIAIAVPDTLKVVIGPDVLALSFFDEHYRKILDMWRNEQIRPVVNRDLLAIYVRVLDRLGVNRDLLEKWALWFTDPEKSLFINERWAPEAGPEEVCAELARRHGAERIEPGGGNKILRHSGKTGL